jgi:predicted NAD-dependent protein-ADP-ribosyltransferase YbiA (DUF1768 family)
VEARGYDFALNQPLGTRINASDEEKAKSLLGKNTPIAGKILGECQEKGKRRRWSALAEQGKMER